MKIPIWLFATLLVGGLAYGDEWKHDSEAGISLSGGNSSAQTYQLKQSTSYIFDPHLLRLSGHFLYGKSAGLDSARNWDGVLRYERSLTPVISGYADNGWEGDTFVGYDYRTYADLGGKYFIIPGDKKVDYLAGELGYRYLYEHHVLGVIPASLTSHMIRVYLEGVQSLTESVTAKAWVEGLPDIANKSNFQLNFEASLAVTLTQHFSLKTAFGGRYRQTPIVATNSNLDTLFTTAMIAKW